MSESVLVTYCAPTLAGIKTANLFSCQCSSRSSALFAVKCWNKALNNKGVYAVLMRYRNKRALIYVYRRSKLIQDFSDSRAKEFLNIFGYGGMTLTQMLEVLSCKLSSQEDFPHEIGIFLGYPIDDVKGFIKNGGKNCKIAGHWKVYADEKRAEKLFCKYKKCTDIYCRKLGEGTPLHRLTVGS
ncbi:MAG: DUF3793 family protein [Anaerovoracaceae bacterium]